MSTFDDASVSFDNFSGKVRLFPLPNLVLFPHVMQPLHIFEPRYRDLLEDALAGDRLMAMAALAPGWEKDYEGRPAIYPMACLGRITTHYRLADGTYNVLLLGLQRARIAREIDGHRAFREAEVELCEDQYPAGQMARQQSLQQRLHDTLVKVLPHMPEAREQMDQLLAHDVPLGVLSDVISYMLELDVAGKQALLAEADVCRRTELLLAHFSAPSTDVGATPAGAAFPPKFSPN
jgi:uncharacterized protein